MKYALALEGGGARGAYEIGAYKTLKERGYEFDTIIGTSIGALNAVVLTEEEGDERKLEELWRNISFDDILVEVDDDKLSDLMANKNINLSNLSEATKIITQAFKKRGIDTSKIRKFFETYVDEDKVRKSSIRFGLVTFNITDFKPEKLFIEDIPKGKLIDYLLATSNLPLFQRAVIEEKKFLDGGTFDNCSVEMLYDAGYRNIVAIRLFLKNRIRNYNTLVKKKDLKLKMFVPSINLPYILNFETNTLNHLIDFGYIDTIKQLDRLDGTFYAINKVDKETVTKNILNIKPMDAYEIVAGTSTKVSVGENIMDVCIKRAIPKISSKISPYKSKVLKNQLLDILEYVASKENIEQNRIYDYEELLTLTKEKIKDKKDSNKFTNAIYFLVKIL